MCNCRKEIEAQLVERIKKQLPEGAVDLGVRLEGYALILSKGPLEMRNALPIKITYQAPTKGTTKKPSVMREKKQTMTMTGSYCMFCGEKYDKDEPAAEPPAAPVH